MDYISNETLRNQVVDLLQEDFNLNYSQIEARLGIKSKEEAIILKKIDNEITSIKLIYNNRKNGCVIIPEITEELKTLIKDNELDFDKENNLVLLTKRNANKINNLIATDPDYFPFAKTIFEKFGFANVKTNKDKALFAVIREIDRDNSTNVWRYKQNRDSFNNVINFILNSDNNFFERLEKGERNLPDIICDKCGNGLKSLSSKICKYLCEFANFSDKHNDNYYINDRYIRHALPFYLDYYGVEKKTSSGKIIKSSRKIDDLSYVELFDLLEKLHIARNNKHNDGEITKNELDHIIWYCYKSFVS